MNTKTCEPSAEHVDAINQIFTELELAYHNQFRRAFPDATQLGMAKQLWLHTLCDLSPLRLRAGVRRAIKSSEYLPSLHTLREYCDPQPQELGLPDVHAAYIEACRAASPKREQRWSHAIVYRAGMESDWFFLANNPESVALPVFKRNYELLIERLLNGENLDVPIPKALPEEISRPLARSEQKKRLQQLRTALGI
jgi:replication protein P